MGTVILDSLPRDLAEKIELAVRTRTGGRIRGLEVRVVDDGIEIFGQASSYYTKQLVTESVLEVGDELAVTNQVEVISC